jgi:hypothetical protein
MAANATTKSKSTTGTAGSSSAPTGVEAARVSVKQTAERTVDVPVGAALTVADRVNEIVEPFTKRQTATREIKRLRQQVVRELNRVERRGTSARRKATQRARTTRNRTQRRLVQRRRAVESAVKQNRTRFEKGLKKAQASARERVSALV